MERMTKRNKDGTAIAPEFADKTYIMQDDHDRFTGYINSPIVDRLAEFEDKLESGQLVELPCIKTLTDQKGILYRVYFMNYAWGENGIIDFYSYRSEKEAEARLKELQEKNDDTDK